MKCPVCDSEMISSPADVIHSSESLDFVDKGGEIWHCLKCCEHSSYNSCWFYYYPNGDIYNSFFWKQQLVKKGAVSTRKVSPEKIIGGKMGSMKCPKCGCTKSVSGASYTPVDFAKEGLPTNWYDGEGGPQKNAGVCHDCRFDFLVAADGDLYEWTLKVDEYGHQSYYWKKIFIEKRKVSSYFIGLRKYQ